MITSVTTVLVDLSASVILGSLWETTAQLALVYTLLLCQAACRLLYTAMHVSMDMLTPFFTLLCRF